MLELTEIMVKAKERKQLVKTLLFLISLAPNFTNQSVTKLITEILLLLLPLLLFEEHKQPEETRQTCVKRGFPGRGNCDSEQRSST